MSKVAPWRKCSAKRSCCLSSSPSQAKLDSGQPSIATRMSPGCRSGCPGWGRTALNRSPSSTASSSIPAPASSSTCSIALPVGTGGLSPPGTGTVPVMQGGSGNKSGPDNAGAFHARGSKQTFSMKSSALSDKVAVESLLLDNSTGCSTCTCGAEAMESEVALERSSPPSDHLRSTRSLRHRSNANNSVVCADVTSTLNGSNVPLPPSQG
mmetsp:Transcript_13308/g.31151  ORF Transcript_13308/g.31151 Transcript_13308/m.31151 type:complete len:210 (+) Transcript_13308:2116-2745(+)